jgi:hypothetical protein
VPGGYNMLRKEVCENCKNKAQGKINWSPHSEMCWKDIGMVLCPPSVIFSFTKKMRKKIRKVTSFSAAEKNLLTGIFSDGKASSWLKDTSSWLKTPTIINEKPPIFCPNKRKH